jgi:hypothetical protein
MKLIRTMPHEKYNCDKVIEVFEPNFCQRVGWTEENNYAPKEPKEKAFILADDVEAEVGWRVRDGVPISPETEILEDIKTDKWIEISEAYKNYDATASADTALGYPLQLGQAHISKFDGAIRFAELTGLGTIYITDSNDVTHYDVPLADAKQALVEVMAAALAAHQRKQELRALITEAATADDVRAISWETA